MARPSARMALVGVLAVAAGGPACALFGARQQPAAEGTATVFISADMRGYLAPCGCSENMRGGIYRAAHQVLHARREAQGEVLYLDAGDSLFPRATLTAQQRPQEERKARALAEAFTLMGLAARAVGPRDLALGEEFLASLALPNVPAGEAQRFGAPELQIWVVAGADQASLRAAAARARAEGARFVVGLFGGTFTEAAKLAGADALGVDLLVPARAAEALDGEENRLLRGRVPVVRIQSKGRTLLRLELSFAAQAGPLELLATDAEAARALHSLGERIALLDKQINQPGLPADAKALRREKLVELVERREALAREKAPSPAGRNAFSVRFVPLDAALPSDPAAKDVVERYDRDVGQINLAWAKAHGQDCPAPEDGEAAFVGNAVCLGCHPNTEAVYAATRHARAYGTLEAQGKQHHLDCVGCHVVGWQRPGGVCRVDQVEGRRDVGCESCHGPGSLHLGNPIASTIRRGDGPQTCLGCHDPENSPHFNFAAYLPEILGPGHGRPLPDAPAP